MFEFKICEVIRKKLDRVNSYQARNSRVVSDIIVAELVTS